MNKNETKIEKIWKILELLTFPVSFRDIFTLKNCSYIITKLLTTNFFIFDLFNILIHEVIQNFDKNFIKRLKLRNFGVFAILGLFVPFWGHICHTQKCPKISTNTYRT